MKICKANRVLIFAVILLVLTSHELWGQSKSLVPLSNQQVYELTSRLQARGHLLSLNPEMLPYTESAIYDALDEVDPKTLTALENKWVKQLRLIIKDEPAGRVSNTPEFYIDWNSGIAFNNTRRKDMYRPLRKDFYSWPFAQLRGLYQYGNLVGNADLRFDFYYEQDPDGLDATNRWYTRNENSYLGYTGEYFKIYVGRFDNQWGMYNQPAALISTNPHTIDQINYTIGKGLLTFRNIYGILDGINSDSVFTGETRFDPNAMNRFIALKRVDWRPFNNLRLSYKEVLIHSGHNAVPEPKYLIPSTVFAFLEANAPYDDHQNLMLSVSAWWRTHDFNFRSEFVLDDIIFGREERGITERGNFIWNMNGTYAPKTLSLDYTFEAEVVSYQAYNTDKANGRYLFLKRGIANQFNDYVFSEVKVNWYAEKWAKGLRISPYYGLLLQGEQEINQDFDSSYPNGDPFEFVLTGTVEKNNRLGADFFYSPNPNFWMKADLGLNLIQNQGHISGERALRFLASFEVGFRYDLYFGL